MKACGTVLTAIALCIACSCDSRGSFEPRGVHEIEACAPTVQRQDAGSIWLETLSSLRLPSTGIWGLESTQLCTAERTGDDTWAITPLDAGAFSAMWSSADRCERVQLAGLAIGEPVQFSSSLDFPMTLPGRRSERTFALRNITDSEVPVQLSGLIAPFAIDGGLQILLAARSSVNVRVEFAPTAIGDVERTLHASVGSKSAPVILRGYGGGPNVEMPAINAGLVLNGAAAGATDIRYFALENVAPAQDARGTLELRPMTGSFEVPSTTACTFPVRVLSQLAAIAPGATSAMEIHFRPRQLGAFSCDVTLQTPNESKTLRLSGMSVALPGCSVTYPLMLQRDGGTVQLPISNLRTTDCWLTAPRLVPRDGGWSRLAGAQGAWIPGSAVLAIEVQDSDFDSFDEVRFNLHPDLASDPVVLIR